MAKILLVEDDKNLSNTIVDFLKAQNDIVEAAYDGNEGLELYGLFHYDLLVIDWELPQMTGVELCNLIRSRGGNVPILFLTGRSSLKDKVEGFESGADDYLTKPFHMKELALRIKALLRRPQALVISRYKVDYLELDPQTHQVFKEGSEIRVTKTEFALLEGFMRQPGTVFTAEEILNRFWPPSADKSPDSLRTALKKLRQKIDIEGRPSLIKNVRGVGYSFE